MKNRKYSLFFVLVLSVAMFLAACGSSDDAESDDKDAAEDDSDYSVGLVTDVGGVDDKSFNQSSWEGLQEWGKEHGLEEKEGYEYAQSDDESDYLPNLNRFVRNDYNLIFGIGFMRSEERRVGKECRLRWSRNHYRKKSEQFRGQGMHEFRL